MGDIAGARKLGNGDQTFNAGTQLGKGAEIVDAQDAAIDHVAFLEILDGFIKGIGLERFHGEGDLFARDFKYLDFDLLTAFEQVLRANYMQPGNLRDV